jgi:hypothetical protein
MDITNQPRCSQPKSITEHNEQEVDMLIKEDQRAMVIEIAAQLGM